MYLPSKFLDNGSLSVIPVRVYKPFFSLNVYPVPAIIFAPLDNILFAVPTLYRF